MGLALTMTDVTWSFAPQAPAFLRVPQWHVGEGQFVALTGPSGAGKSTLLFLLAGLETPASGRLDWGGYEPAVDRPSRRDAWRRQNLGLVFQDFQLVPELTALQNVLLPLTFARWSVPTGERARAAALLEQLGVPRADAPTSTLSRGEMQRVALARAVFGRPAVLLADEPTASLDASNEAAVAQLLVDACRQHGMTAIVSTHQTTLQTSADVRVALNHGTFAGEFR